MYFMGLVMVDFSVLIFFFIYMVFFYKIIGKYWKYYDVYIFFLIVNVCVIFSVWIIVLLIIERFLFVRYLFWVKVKCDRVSVKVKILGIVGLVVVFNILRFLLFKVYEFRLGIWVLEYIEFRRSDNFFGINWVYSIIV